MAGTPFSISVRTRGSIFFFTIALSACTCAVVGFSIPEMWRRACGLLAPPARAQITRPGAYLLPPARHCANARGGGPEAAAGADECKVQQEVGGSAAPLWSRRTH